MEKNKRIVLAKRPEGLPDESIFRLEECEFPRISEGLVLVKGVYFSVDPYMRGRMIERRSYIPPFSLNETISGGVVAEVIESRSGTFQAGDYVTGMLPWQIYSLGDPRFLRKVDAKAAPVSTALGVLGLTGLTAYFGMLDIGRPVPGETAVVSGAAGAVGMVAGQIARIRGSRAVGIAGSAAKVDYILNELGFDAAIDYKKTDDIGPDLDRACPDGVDVYFDNVGGGISDEVIQRINDNARIPLCGQISLYNATDVPMGPRLQPVLLTRSALMQGFIISNYADRFQEGIGQLAAWMKEGRIKYAETIIDGFENLPRAFLGLFSGENLGKLLVRAF